MLTSNGAFSFCDLPAILWVRKGGDIKIRTILYGILLYLAFEAWVTFLSILEVANQNLYLTILEVIPWVMFVAVLMIAVLVVIVPWEWVEEGM